MQVVDAPTSIAARAHVAVVEVELSDASVTVTVTESDATTPVPFGLYDAPTDTLPDVTPFTVTEHTASSAEPVKLQVSPDGKLTEPLPD